MHDLKLELLDASGRSVAEVDRPLSELTVIGTTSRESTTSLIVVSRSNGELTSDSCPILDFLPPTEGEYTARFSLREQAGGTATGVNWKSSVEYASLTVRENAEPLSGRGYRHDRVDVTQTAGSKAT